MVKAGSLGASLATCTDATVLVPGSAAALRADADQLDQQARALAEHVVEIRAAKPEAWRGSASDGWAGQREQYAETLDTISQLHQTAASTLRLHADAVEWGQGRATVAVQLYAHGCRLRDAQLGAAGPILAAGPAHSATDAGAQYRALAQDALTSAQEQVAASGRAAAEVLNQLSDGLPDGRWHLGDFTTGMWSWVTGMAGMLWKFSTIRAQVDPAGVLRDGQELLDGGVGTYGALTAAPIGTGQELAQLDMLRDRPAQWWGQLTPDIALAAVGGAGLATKAMRGAALSEEIATAGEDVTSAARRLYEAGSRWEDPVERARWLEEYAGGSVAENPNLRRIPATGPANLYQLDQTGPAEVRFTTNGQVSWADGVQLDSDAVAAVEVKFSGTPGRSPYTGTAPAFITDPEMLRFEGQIRQYGEVLADGSNPVARLRLVTNEQAVADFLGPRARALLGPDIDFQIVVRPD